MKVKTLALVAVLLLSLPLMADTLGPFELTSNQFFFQKGGWQKTTTPTGCRVYTATGDSTVIVGHRVFRAVKGLTVTKCDSSGAFDEGFEEITPK